MHQSKRTVQHSEDDDMNVLLSAQEPNIKRLKKKPRTDKVKKTDAQVCECTGCDQRLL